MVQSLSLELCDLVPKFICLILCCLWSLKCVSSCVFFCLLLNLVVRSPSTVLILVCIALLHELELLFESCDFLMCFFFIESSLGDKLASQVLHLTSIVSLNSVTLLAHNGSPDTVKLIEDLGNTGLSHLRSKLLLDLLDNSNSLCWDPFILEVGAT